MNKQYIVVCVKPNGDQEELLRFDDIKDAESFADMANDCTNRNCQDIYKVA
jgi:predicted RNA-binding protein YlxR (DUF448 family)